MREIFRYASERGINNFRKGGLKDVYPTKEKYNI